LRMFATRDLILKHLPSLAGNFELYGFSINQLQHCSVKANMILMSVFQ